MQKYRRLQNSELAEFEKEFISFLVVNGIQANEWVQLKEDEPDKAEKIIEQFSDVVYESVLRKTMFIEHVAADSIKCFQCLENEIVLVGLDAKTGSGINFLGEQTLESIILNNIDQLSVFQTRKKYLKNREEEMFDLLSSGANLSKGKLFKQISLLL